MSDSLDSLAIMTVQSNAGVGYEYLDLWYFEDEGLKRSKSRSKWDPDGITDLSAKEKLRWSKVCEWLDNFFRRNPARRIPARRNPQSEGQILYRFLGGPETDLKSALMANVSNFPGGLLDGTISSAILAPWKDYYDYIEFLLILVILSLVYGGVHLATWNFSFASETEHLLWKIACIDIMAAVPVGVLWILVLDLLTDSDWLSLSDRKHEILETSSNFLAGIGFYALLVFYALARIYIVVEVFISLRHVPIGVYAAVPWVQAIPHV